MLSFAFQVEMYITCASSSLTQSENLCMRIRSSSLRSYINPTLQDSVAVMLVLLFVF